MRMRERVGGNMLVAGGWVVGVMVEVEGNGG